LEPDPFEKQSKEIKKSKPPCRGGALKDEALHSRFANASPSASSIKNCPPASLLIKRRSVDNGTALVPERWRGAGESDVGSLTQNVSQKPMASYLTILAVAFLGALNGPWYLLFLGAAVLTLIALRNQRPYQPRFAALGIAGILETTAYASAAHALLAAIAAYALGVFTRFIFILI
jgi:hypothetical protein